MTGDRERRRLRIAVAAVIVVAGASTGRAATEDEPARLFVDGVAIASVELRAHTELPPPGRTINLTSTVPAGGIGIGGFLAPRVSVRFEGVLPARITKTDTLATTTGILRSTTTNAIDYDTFTAAMLAGYHAAPRGRLHVAFVGGIAFIGERTRQGSGRTVTDVRSNAVVSTTASSTTTTTYRPTPEVGADFGIRLTTHFDLTPELRALAFTGALSIRPAIALRWLP